MTTVMVHWSETRPHAITIWVLWSINLGWALPSGRGGNSWSDWTWPTNSEFGLTLLNVQVLGSVEPLHAILTFHLGSTRQIALRKANPTPPDWIVKGSTPLPSRLFLGWHFQPKWETVSTAEPNPGPAPLPLQPFGTPIIYIRKTHQRQFT